MLEPIGPALSAGPGRPLSASRSTASAAAPPLPAAGIRRPAAWVVAAAALALAGLTRAAAPAVALPYVPTSVLFSEVAGDVAYVFNPNGTAVDLLALNVSDTVGAGSGSATPKTLSSGLPFLPAGRHTAFTPSLLDNGTIAVLAGDCADATNASLWTFAPPAGPWTRHALAPSSDWDYGQGGPYFLGGSLSFSAQLAPVMSEPVLYVYGGMCPSANSTAESWQSSAAYSNRMLRVSPPSPSAAGSPAPFTVDYTPSAGPPIAEAGFSWTALAPSLSNRSGIVTQQTSHVLLGGHTQQAFINMSTAALWSLPEESWTFVSIKASASSSSNKPDLLLASRQDAVVSIDSRSGHTAVLSADGTALVVLGGWVGDVSQPAAPQLAVVDIGASFDDWRWQVPPQEAQPKGPGIYGHGAALLPGNVMMVYGGFDIAPQAGSESESESGGSRRRQAAESGGGGGGVRMFLNITSLTWLDDYTNPSSVDTKSGGTGGGSSHGGGGGDGGGSSSGGDGAPADSSSGPSKRLQIGLGVGLGVGLAVLLALVAGGVCMRRRQTRRRAQRDAALRGLSQGVNGSLPRQHRPSGEFGDDDGDDDDDGDGEMLERGGMLGPWNAASARDWYTGGLDPYDAGTGRRSLGYETLRGGTKSSPSLYLPASVGNGGGNGPSVRPRAAARGLHQPPPPEPRSAAAGYDFTPLRSSNRNFEPIYEEANEDGLDDEGDLGAGAGRHPLLLHDERSGSNNNNNNNNNNTDDPFLTPTESGAPGGGAGGGFFALPASDGSRTPSPEARHLHHSAKPRLGQDPEVQGWVSDVDAADAVLTAKISRHGSTTTTPPARGQGQGSPPGNGSGGGGRTSPSRPPSTSARSSRSAKALAGADDDAAARTGSNLSERSAFSFAPPQQQQHPGTGAAATGDGRLGSSSGSSAHTFSTAKSNFATLQAEGPGLLLLPSAMQPQQQQHKAAAAAVASISPSPDEDYDYEYLEDANQQAQAPGSPSKSKPRRSWFGSLRRVFSGGTATSSSAGSGSPPASSRGDSPTLLGGSGGGGGSSDYEAHHRLLGLGGGGGGVLLRRKQGREAWDASSPSAGGVASASLSPGPAGERVDDEWDIERAVEQRLVQVMFTVPKERLRVVNADDGDAGVDEEMEAVVVSPGDDDYDDDGDDDDDDEEDYYRQRYDDDAGGDEGGLTPPPLQVRPRQVEPPDIDAGAEADKGQERDEPHGAVVEAEVEAEAAAGGGMALSPDSGSLRTASITTTATAATLNTAEAVKLQRPSARTRVLEMVESIESRSTDSSPCPSPTRA
ncbi:hypothetical protein B0T24DRAFT_296994 [Lasiosphaeria ovina]|uniref:Galactose oxidase n=1 Tax=Lasiosphaeria ovina TaxID=92902 RepID=A0AAE0KEF2_9PEZI|nr:hypothetical protein B0T24DRAFT_296994 [Lasiosphaeria ovina]